MKERNKKYGRGWETERKKEKGKESQTMFGVPDIQGANTEGPKSWREMEQLFNSSRASPRFLAPGSLPSWAGIYTWTPKRAASFLSHRPKITLSIKQICLPYQLKHRHREREDLARPWREPSPNQSYPPVADRRKMPHKYERDAT